ncbi:MAG TPA: hypothetical protein VE422_11475 [Terriglobia bacterium]|nr:hypothetical protein [Terriglobia bacterium]
MAPTVQPEIAQPRIRRAKDGGMGPTPSIIGSGISVTIAKLMALATTRRAACGGRPRKANDWASPMTAAVNTLAPRIGPKLGSIPARVRIESAAWLPRANRSQRFRSDELLLTTRDSKNASIRQDGAK